MMAGGRRVTTARLSGVLPARRPCAMAKVLIIEDDDETADYLVKGLAESGHLADRAATGTDGLGMALSGSYHALVVDRMLLPLLDQFKD